MRCVCVPVWEHVCVCVYACVSTFVRVHVIVMIDQIISKFSKLIYTHKYNRIKENTIAKLLNVFRK